MRDGRSKIALFIDGSNLHSSAKALGFELDYRRLLEEFRARGTLLRAFYYTAVVEDQEYSSVRPLVDWLGYNGFTVVTKPAKEFVDPAGFRKIKRSMDVELAVNAMEIGPRVDDIVLFSGDGNFRSLVQALQRQGTRVSVVSSIATNPALIADELRRQADVFIELAELKPKLCRASSEAPAGEAPQVTPAFLRRRSVRLAPNVD